MTIDTELYLIVGALAFGAVFAAWQSIRLRAIYQSKSSWVGAITFLLLGARQVYILLRLKANIADARVKGVMIEHLSTEQLIVGVLWTALITAGFILWQHLQHRDLKKLGL